MKPPVFIVGCPRSGTTLLYHMLLSSGGFVHFRSETRAYNTIRPRFGRFDRVENRRRFVSHWTKTHHFRLTGLEDEWVRKIVVERCRTTGDFLHEVLGEMARRESAVRWAECTPGHALHIPSILHDLREARILHVIRDGRDVALSLERLGWIRPLPFDRGAGLQAAAVYWSWLVGRACDQGRRYRQSYLEVRFEDLVEQPAATLSEIGGFIHHELDYDVIQRNAVGSVSRPNTSFDDIQRQSPVGRWRERLSFKESVDLEAHLHPMLETLGYPLSARPRVGLATGRRLVYQALFDLKHWLKTATPLGRRLTSLELLEDGLPLDADPRS